MDWLLDGTRAVSRRPVFARVGRLGLALAAGVGFGASAPEKAQAQCGQDCLSVCSCTQFPGTSVTASCNGQDTNCNFRSCGTNPLCECAGPCCVQARYTASTNFCNCRRFGSAIGCEVGREIVWVTR
jgi:hypothetical protein